VILKGAQRLSLSDYSSPSGLPDLSDSNASVESRTTFRKNLKDNLGLYMVTADLPGRTHLEVAEAAIEGGATVIQYRDKTATGREMYECALKIRELATGRKILFIVNDRIDIAQAVEADGVHLGREDIEIDIVREIMGNECIIGISATTFKEAVEASEKGADYIGVGPIFPTPSKDDAAEPIGIRGLRQIREALSIPIVAIGGISIDNSEDIVKAGADGIAVISAVAGARDMVAAAKELTARITLAKRSV
jgi:thiamine-phosphate pyrophosphorylase